MMSEEFDDFDDETVSDPLEGINRAIFYFNDRFYFRVVLPVGNGYNMITPGFFRTGVKNFFYNLMFPVRLVGSLLQGKLERAFQETCRFTVNTAVGLGGFMTPSSHYPWLNPPKEDVGQAMASWGIGNGPYIVLPFIGGSTLRDAIGFTADQFLYPFAYLDPFWLYMPVKAYQYFNDWSFSLDDYPALKDASMDPYVSVKDAYIQYRNRMIRE
jgi:phospholipid-binding lipoprotein MlaA